jgi:phosphate transport system protein
MQHQHTVKSFDEELARLSNIIVEMGGLAESQLAGAIKAVTKRDSELAARIISEDGRIDALEHQVEVFAVRLLALRQPMADDLRKIVASIKIAADIERIGDYAANVAKRALALNQMRPVSPVKAVPRMGKLAQEIIKETLDAYVEQDAERAIAARKRDEELDDLYTAIFRELLTYMMEDPRTITSCTHLMFIAKNIERIGDHATNIAENIHFLVTGEPLADERPKGDISSYAVVPAPAGPRPVEE